ncbi:hypothetical protein GQX74_014524 [Glossina fuscipes]|nr:hypothetical protein GQX74_014524 [Glossina fuscipes]
MEVQMGIKNRKRKSLRTNANTCDRIIVDDDDCIVPVKRIRQQILSSSEGSDDDLSHQSSFNNLPVAEDVSNHHDSLEPCEESDSRSNFPSLSKPIEFFELFFDSTLWELIGQETNKYAEYSRHSPRELKSFETEIWTPVTVFEVKAFIAVLLEMEITRKPNISSYWSENSLDNSLCFPPGHAKYEPCAKCKSLVDHANKVFKLHYKPHIQLSIDESLVGTQCHSSITQYLPNKKHHRWGIEFWMLCDCVSKYCLAFSCYKGAKETISTDRKKFEYDVVVNLLEDKEEDVTITKKRHGREKRSTKPAIVQSYNDFMGGVDESNKMLYIYLDERTSVKYWKKESTNLARSSTPHSPFRGNDINLMATTLVLAFINGHWGTTNGFTASSQSGLSCQISSIMIVGTIVLEASCPPGS